LYVGFFFFLNGSVLWELCWEESYFGTARGVWKERANILLKRAFEHFNDFCKRNVLVSSHPSFTCAGLHMSSLQSNPMLTAKGSNSLQITRWLATITHHDALASPMNEHKQLRAACLWGCTQIFAICQPCFWLSDENVRDLKIAKLVALTSYKALCSESLTMNKNRFPLKPKHHLLDHTVRDACASRLSPTTHWCFSDEDFIGRMKRLSQKTHLTTLPLRVLSRWHLRLWYTLARQH
jgi:hypothetical protein